VPQGERIRLVVVSEPADLELPQGVEDLPVLLTAIGVAALLGLTRSRVSQLMHEGKLPPAVASINHERPAWLASQFDDRRRSADR
jgi:predicted DNA-binding transcriptional regulator AlpA